MGSAPPPERVSLRACRNREQHNIHAFLVQECTDPEEAHLPDIFREPALGAAQEKTIIPLSGAAKPQTWKITQLLRRLHDNMAARARRPRRQNMHPGGMQLHDLRYTCIAVAIAVKEGLGPRALDMMDPAHIHLHGKATGLQLYSATVHYDT